MSKDIAIIGAGMAGLLAGAMLRSDATRIYEAQANLPNNHSAVLRFRSSVVADTLNIPFREVQVMKAVAPWMNPIADAMAYSIKTNGTARLRSITSADGGLSKRWVAPPDLIRRMADHVSCEIAYGRSSVDNWGGHNRVISTIPMPALMDILDYRSSDGSRPSFGWRSGLNIIVELDDVDSYCSLYVPDPSAEYARISITGGQMIIECPGFTDMRPDRNCQMMVDEACFLTGIPHDRVRSIDVRGQPYAKILPMNELERRRFILWASQEHSIYSLGRYATWRPGLLLDDVVNDVRVIYNLITGGSDYDHRK